MKRKIEWYKEVLSLEPGSKVFFPLARLYAESGQTDDAMAVLRQGVERHPEHLEARLLLVELMGEVGLGEEAGREAAGLGELLSRYPGFWRLWADSLTAASPDAALALRVLAMQLKGEPMSWSQLLERGLRSYAAEAAFAGQTSPAPIAAVSSESAVPTPRACRESEVLLAPEATLCPPPSPIVDAPTEIGEFLAERGLDAGAPPPAGEAVDAAELAAVDTLLGEQSDEAPPQTAQAAELEELGEPAYEDVDAFAQALESEVQAAEPVPAPVADLGEADEVADEPAAEAKSSDEASLRTATMAEILAEQGDYQAALDIYRDLRNQAESPEQTRRAAERMEELEALLGLPSSNAPEEVAAKTETVEPERRRSKKKLVGALGALADRLEARAETAR